MHDKIVRAGYQEGEPHLGHLDDLGEKPVDQPAFMLGHLNIEQRLQSYAHGLWGDIGVEPAQDALMAQTLQPLMGARRRQADRRGDLLVGETSIVLQQLQDAEIYSV